MCLVGRGMNLGLLVDRAVAQKHVGDVLNRLVVHQGRMRSGNDVDVVPQSHASKFILDAVGVPGDGVNGFDRRQFLVDRQKLQGKQFWKQHEIGAVFGNGFDEVAHDVEKLVHGFQLPLLVLDRRQTNLVGKSDHCRSGTARHLLFTTTMRIAPHQMRGMAQRIGILIRVVIENSEKLKPLPQLETEHRVPQLAVAHQLYVLLRGLHLLLLTLEARDTAAKHDTLQVKIPTKLFAARVKPLSDAMSAVTWVNKDFKAVEVIALWIVTRSVSLAGNVVPGMLRQRTIASNAE